jgi:hypothetical protein
MESMKPSEGTDAVSGPGLVSRRRALGLGAAVAGGVWAAPMIMSFDAASATSSGAGPTTSTTAPGPTTTTTAPPTTTTTAPGRTITASVTGSIPGVTNPAPVTVEVGEPIELVFTPATYPSPYAYYIQYWTVDGTAIAGADYTGVTSESFSFVELAAGAPSATVTIQTTATGPGANTAFTVEIQYAN